MIELKPNYDIPNCFYVARHEGRVFILFFDDFFGAEELENECLVYSTDVEDFLANIAEDALNGGNGWAYDLELDRFMLSGRKQSPHLYMLAEWLVTSGMFKPITKEIVNGWKDEA